jgi:hypothetical protein
MAPAKLAVEMLWTRGDHQRAFRLSRAIDPERIYFPGPLPFPAGEPAEARFALPGDARPIRATVRLHERDAEFLGIEAADRARITAYFKERLGLI